MEDQEIINNNLRMFDAGKVRLLNVIRLNTGSTLVHELKKCEVAFNLLSQGRTIIVEGELRGNRGRPDITVLDLDNPIAYEVLKSEELSNIRIKEKKYGMRIVPVMCE